MLTAQTSAPVPIAMHVPRTTLGVERMVFAINIGAAMLLFSIFRSAWVALTPALFHFVGMWLTKRYPDLVRVYMRYRRQHDYYRPWGEPRVCNRRPDGYGRGMG